MDLLDEIEGAITDDGHPSTAPIRNVDNNYGNPIPPQYQHSQAFRLAPPFAPAQPYHQQPEHLNYDQPSGFHLGSSSSYSQVDSPSPAHGRRVGLPYHTNPASFPPSYSTAVGDRAAYDRHGPIDAYQYRQQGPIATLLHAHVDQSGQDNTDGDDSGAGLYGYGEQEMQDREWEPAAIVEETGDRGAMKQMQSHGIPLKPTTVLPDAMRSIFNFSNFNAVQSKVFDSAYKTDENLVVSAPTGSGKTVIFELAILRVVMNKQFHSGEGRSLCVYMAPLKALCSEKAEEWKVKLKKIGLVTAEVTGDTASDKGFLSQIKNADVIITTPEKWDSVTRRTSQKQRILERLALMMLDEVHILNEERGATLETVVARMRTSGKNMPVRVVALSATIPNVEDVARWLRPTMANSSAVFEAGGANPGIERGGANGVLQIPMAKVYKFGEDFRPTKLTRIVKGYPLNSENPFPLINRIVSELFQLICDHSQGKPTLIFVPTRNLCIKAAAAIAKAYETALESGRRVPWSNHGRPKLSCESKNLEEYSACGVAFHHGGLSLEDRRKVETAFRSGKIMVIVATSTLAVGVNLPARTVILAGTYQWSGLGMIDLSDLDVQQMIGRAGRPQYDTEGTAIILCSEKNQGKYRDLINSSTTIESCLHDHLIEHINTEIGLRTITCLQEGEEWIRNSFLYVRIQQNPRHYSGILSAAGVAAHQWESALTRLVEKAVEDLQSRDMVEIQDNSGTPEPPELRNISATIYGETMSSSCLSFKTMCSILDIPAKSSLETLLHVLSSAHEYADLKLRNGEKVFYKALAKDADMRFQLPNGVVPTTAAHKVFFIVQMTLGNVDIDKYKEHLKQGASGPALDSYQVFRMAPRICKAMATVALQKEDGETLKNALQLTRIVSGKAWPGSSVIFRQIDAIGAKSIQVLASKGITSFQSLARTDPRKIEMLLNRQTGFGNKIVAAAKAFPVFNVIIKQETQVPSVATAPVDIQFRVEISVEGSLVDSIKKKHGQPRTISVVALLSDGTYVAYRKANVKTLRIEDLTITLPARIQYTNQKFQVIVGLDQASGCSTQAEFKPEVPDGILESPVINGMAKIEDQEDVEPPKTATRPLPPPPPPPPQLDDEKDELLSSGAEEDATVVRLSNGNWPCSHSCTDKRACKHKCCKEGTKKKPKTGPKRALGKDPSKQGAASRGNGGDVKLEISPGPPNLSAPKKTQAKSNRVRRKVPIKGNKVIDLCADSEASSTEDEKEAVGRILGTQLKGHSRKPKRLRLAYTDSDEFDDPAFDDVVQHMDIERTTGPTSQLSKNTARLVKGNTARAKDIVHENSHENSIPARSEPLASRIDATAGKKGNRPQPVRRVRARSRSESVAELPRPETGLDTNTDRMDCDPDPEEKATMSRSETQFQPTGPLFMNSDDDVDRQEDLAFLDHEPGLERDEDGDELDTYLDLDEYMEDTEASNLKSLPVTEVSDSKRLSGLDSPVSFGPQKAAGQQTDVQIRQAFIPKRLPPGTAKLPVAVHEGELADSRNGSGVTESKSLKARSRQPSRTFSQSGQDASLELAATSVTRKQEADGGVMQLDDRSAEHDAAADFLEDFDKWLNDSVAPGD